MYDLRRGERRVRLVKCWKEREGESASEFLFSNDSKVCVFLRPPAAKLAKDAKTGPALVPPLLLPQPLVTLLDIMGKRTAPQASSSKAKPAAPATSSSKPAKRARFEGPAVTKSAAAPKPAPRQSKQAKQEAAIKAAQAIPTPPAPTTFTVSAGSYERLLYGLSCSFVPTSKPSTITGLPYELVASPIFSFPAHLSSLKSVASSLVPSPGTGSERKVGGKYLVSGGTDEVVKVWDLKRRKEVGSLEGDASGTLLSVWAAKGPPSLTASLARVQERSLAFVSSLNATCFSLLLPTQPSLCTAFAIGSSFAR